MTEFLVYFPDPYGVGGSKYAIASPTGIVPVAAQNISQAIDVAITYDAMTLVDDLRRSGGSLPRVLIDMGEAIRLVCGLAKSDGGEQRWSFWKRAKSHFGSPSDWRRAQALHEGRELHPPEEDLIATFGLVANAVTSLWREVEELLITHGEVARFYEVEVPVAQIFYHRQFKGLPIDKARISAALEEASVAKYEAYREVATTLQISATGLTYWNIGQHLPRTDVPAIEEQIEGYALRDQLKLAVHTSTFAKSFTEYQAASRDVAVLTRLSDADERVHPVFHPFGTVSGRILVSDPYLQEMRRRFRSVIASEDGHSLVYFDYSQFEPGIMASLSEDVDLIRLYNTGDVYSALSTSLFGSGVSRDLAKKVFLAFSYGMSASGISSLVAGKNADETSRLKIERAVTAFFEQFRGVRKFKADAETNLSRNGYVKSVLGNHRRRAQRGALSHKEKRWALSHAVQSTASLIFKKSLIEIDKEFGTDSMLLPMHDAILMQLGNNQIEEASDRVSQIMEAAFVEICPQLKVRVTNGQF
ncbi:DNA polymerase I, thermostable [compost metagenome]